MRATHLVGPVTTAGVLPLCGDWVSMDTDWTTVPSQVTCAACAADMRSLAARAAISPDASRSR